MSKADDANRAARQKAQDLLARVRQADADRVETRAKRRQAEDEKTARLRALRLAKEAADKQQGVALSPGVPRSKRSRAG
jgi:hypothetical protein